MYEILELVIDRYAKHGAPSQAEIDSMLDAVLDLLTRSAEEESSPGITQQQIVFNINVTNPPPPPPEDQHGDQ
jgi:hypothetical protein